MRVKLPLSIQYRTERAFTFDFHFGGFVYKNEMRFKIKNDDIFKLATWKPVYALGAPYLQNVDLPDPGPPTMKADVFVRLQSSLPKVIVLHSFSWNRLLANYLIDIYPCKSRYY